MNDRRIAILGDVLAPLAVQAGSLGSLERQLSGKGISTSPVAGLGPPAA